MGCFSRRSTLCMEKLGLCLHRRLARTNYYQCGGICRLGSCRYHWLCARFVHRFCPRLVKDSDMPDIMFLGRACNMRTEVLLICR